MKPIPSYVIVENCDGTPYITVYPLTDEGLRAAIADFKDKAIENDVALRDPETFEQDIASAQWSGVAETFNLSNGEDYDLILTRSET